MKKYTFDSTQLHFANENTFLSKFSKPYSLFWNVYKIDTAEFIGNIDIRSETKDFKECEIGYVVGKEFQNNGYGSQFVEEILQFLKNNFDTKIFYAKYFESNLPSARVLEKNGFNIISNRNGLIRVKKNI